MFGDCADKILVLKIYEANAICKNKTKTSYSYLVDEFCKMPEYQHLDRCEVRQIVSKNLDKLYDFGAIEEFWYFGKNGALLNFHKIEPEFEPIAEIWYRHNISRIRESLSDEQITLLDEIINSDNFDIAGETESTTADRINTALALASYELVRYDLCDLRHTCPMATVLGAVVNNEWLIGSAPFGPQLCQEIE